MTLSFDGRPVEAVLFDLDNGLVPFLTVRAWQWAWRPQGPLLGERRVGAALRSRLKAWDRRRWQGLTGHAPPADLEALTEHLEATLTAVAGHELPEEERDAVVRRLLHPASEVERYPDAAPVLSMLGTEGVKAGVLTPLPLDSARWLLRRAGLPEGLVLAAGDPPGPVVPDAGVLRGAAERLGTTPDRAVVVGDLLWSDVRAAHRAGFGAVLLDRYDVWPNITAERVTSLDGLEALLRGTVSSASASAAPPTS